MKVIDSDGLTSIFLDPECSIRETENDLKCILNHFKSTNSIRKIIINAEKVSEIDTAYFQFLLSLLQYCKEKEINFESESTHTLNAIQKYYGINIF